MKNLSDDRVAWQINKSVTVFYPSVSLQGIVKENLGPNTARAVYMAHSRTFVYIKLSIIYVAFFISVIGIRYNPSPVRPGVS